MKNKQSGIGHLGVVVTILVVAIMGGAGWYVYTHNKKPNTNTSSESQTSNTSTEKSMETSDVNKTDVTIHDVELTINSVSDLDKLPTYTPASFKKYLQTKVEENLLKDNGCGAKGLSYNISKISQVNIRGAVGPIVSNNESCYGGGGALWVLTPSGNWDDIGLQSFPPCTSTNGGKIYEEFATSCSTDLVNRSDSTKNPNGSIKSLAQ